MAWGWDSSAVWARGFTGSSCKWPRGGDSSPAVRARDCTGSSCKWPRGGTVHLGLGPGVALDLDVNGLGVGQFTCSQRQGLHWI